MSTLTLTVLRCPESVTAEQRVVTGGELTLGRGAECGWSLADPLKSLSRNHCRLEYFSGTWRVCDLSVNGTFVNFSVSPIGRDGVQALRDGDRLRLGDYEIEVRIDDRTGAAVAPLPFGAGGMAPPVAPGRGFASTPLPGLDTPVDFSIGLGRPPFGDRTGPVNAVPDHAAASAGAFMPPAAVPGAKAIIPDDWYRTDDASAVPAPAPAAPPVRPAFVPVAAPAALPGAHAQSAAAGDLATALYALMAGGQVPPDLVVRAAADPDAALQNAGALLRAAVTGLRALLIARGSVKREFRIEQTMLRPSDNNPLKFAASDVHALAALLDPRTPGLAAVQESISDLTLHQVATLAATQAAARALLERLAPGKMEAEDTGGGLMPGAREKRLWEAYKRRHAKLLEQFEDDFESAFGTAFARAYEQAAADAKG